MGLENDAFVAASHFCLIGVLLLLILRLVWLFDGGLPASTLNRTHLLGMAILALGLIVERSYYVAARLLTAADVDLWQMHPAPGVLSAAVFGCLFVMKATLTFSLYPMHVARRRLALEFGGFVALWAVTVWILF